MSKIERFEDIIAWQRARELNKVIYSFINRTPFDKDYDLRRQINASCGSIMDNIAEGFERGGNKEFINFLIISKGSAGETRSQLYRAVDRNYIDQNEFENACNDVKIISQMLQRLIEYLKKSELKGIRYKAEEDEGIYLPESINQLLNPEPNHEAESRKAIRFMGAPFPSTQSR
ncbi:MAG: four helix bundle protein [Bacteroidetes bacterium]|jgi:four helix bundle protein|nr:four helix bundle protein [Bacteroidota bacterium]